MQPLDKRQARVTDASLHPLSERDDVLVRGLRSGDPAAFTEMFEQYSTPIYNYLARMLGDSEDAKDVTQDVFIKAFRNLPQNGNALHLRPWLYRVATTTALDHLRSRRRRAAAAHPIDEDLPATRDGFEQAEASRLVETTLSRLSERHRTVLVLKDLHGLHHDEIAGVLGISRGATETLLFRARAAFRRIFLDLSTSQVSGARSAARADIGIAVSLAFLLPNLTLPSGLEAPAIAAAVGASSTGAIAAGGLSGGMFAKLGGAVATKVALVAAAATVTVSGVEYVERHRDTTPHTGTRIGALVASPSPTVFADGSGGGWGAAGGSAALARLDGHSHRGHNPVQDAARAERTGDVVGQGASAAAHERNDARRVAAGKPARSAGQSAKTGNGAGATRGALGAPATGNASPAKAHGRRATKQGDHKTTTVQPPASPHGAKSKKKKHTVTPVVVNDTSATPVSGSTPVSVADGN
jgi:RNA polymerase sigma-70 factor, ECF subfamily